MSGETVSRRTGLLLAALLLGALRAAPADAGELRLERAALAADATWDGTVTLVGMNVVKKGAVLTILPGTVVRFEHTDDDGDGIGDGELTVEGTVLARGTPERPIRFTSARPDPGDRDWTFVQISTSRGSVLEHCDFEHAFTGVQVHYSSGAVVRDCVFRDNFEGLRFSTTDVLIEHNDFLGNGTGIRYESHGSRAVVRRNAFRDNGYAFFPAQRSTSTALFRENNVTGSRTYAVNVGFNQRVDLDFSGNWWGTADRAAIEDLMYDRSKDPLLGRIMFEPFLTAPVEECGARRKAP